jgi:hypothetical protein
MNRRPVRPRLASQIVATTPKRPPIGSGREAKQGALRLAIPLEIERSWSPDREAQLAALRVALGLPRVLPHPAGESER